MAKKKIWQRLTEKNWCKEQGTSDDGKAHCAIGWITKVYPNSSYLVCEELRQYLDRYQHSVLPSIAHWNDNPRRKLQDVKKAFKAINR